MKFPPEITQFLRDPRAKKAWISSSEGPNRTGCANCNGLGIIVATIGISGPFNAPTNMNHTYHWDNGWWLTVSKVAECPVCKNEVPVKSVSDDKRVQPAMDRLTRDWTV